METEHFYATSGNPKRAPRRACHLFILFISMLFLFLLALESVAYLILGAWHLSIPRLENLRIFSGEIYRRELGFGILLVILGSFGILISIIGLFAMVFLRLALLRTFGSCLWLMMIFGIAVGIIGVVFGTQVDGFLSDDQTRNPNLDKQYYYDEKFLLVVNGSLTLFMSATLIVGLIVVCCLSSAVHYRSTVRAK